MDTFPKSPNLLPSLASWWSITFRTSRRGCCYDEAMMAPPLVNNVCALFSPTVKETVPHPIDIVRGHIHQMMGEEKDQNRAQSSRVHTLVHNVCNEKCELVHFSSGIPIGRLQPNLPHELVQQHAHVPQGGLTVWECFLSHFFQIVNSNPELEKELVHKYVVSGIDQLIFVFELHQF